MRKISAEAMRKEAELELNDLYKNSCSVFCIFRMKKGRKKVLKRDEWLGFTVEFVYNGFAYNVTFCLVPAKFLSFVYILVHL